MGDYALAKFYDNKEEYDSYYIYAQHRGKGIYKSIIPKLEHRVLIGDDCQLETFLTKQGVDHLKIGMTPYNEYRLISHHYGAGKAERSQVYFMNHIDEGIALIRWTFQDIAAEKAYSLHPIFQSNDALREYPSHIVHQSDPFIIMYVMEYRHIANAYLSKRKIADTSEIVTSPITHVNIMLYADKIQNYKDFEMYHKGTHPRSADLDEYFQNWLKRLHVTPEHYIKMKQKITINPTIYG